MKPPRITCPTCGTGTVPLGKGLSSTLAKLRRSKRPRTTEELSDEKVGRTAIVERMKELERLGLAEQRGKIGKSVLWIATSAK